VTAEGNSSSRVPAFLATLPRDPLFALLPEEAREREAFASALPCEEAEGME